MYISGTLTPPPQPLLLPRKCKPPCLLSSTASYGQSQVGENCLVPAALSPTTFLSAIYTDRHSPCRSHDASTVNGTADLPERESWPSLVHARLLALPCHRTLARTSLDHSAQDMAIPRREGEKRRAWPCLSSPAMSWQVYDAACRCLWDRPRRQWPGTLVQCSWATSERRAGYAGGSR
jgi:hypothetical protein